MSSTAIDLGHHLALAAHGNSGPVPSGRLVRLGADSDGLVIRWCEPGTPTERFHDRLHRLVAAGHVRDAAETADAIADCLTELVPQRGSIRIAVPMRASAGHLAHLRAAFTHAGYELDPSPFVPRPYAVLAHWLATTHGNYIPRGKTLVIDNDGGSTSAIVVDITRNKIMAAAQLTVAADSGGATAAVRALLESSYGTAGVSDPVPWSVLSASIADIVVAGSAAEHPVFRRFVAERFPASTLHTASRPLHEVVVRGLLELDRLIGYRCTWPTVDLVLDGQLIRRAGSTDPDEGSATVAPVGSRLGFGSLPIVFGGGTGEEQASDALIVPRRVGPFPLLSTQASGAIEIRGTDSSLRLHPDWPVPGITVRSIRVVVEDILDLTIDRRPFTPRDGPTRRATDEW